MKNSNLIFFYGPPLSGKTTLGREFAQRMELPFHDLDSMIEERTGTSITDLFSSKGEDHFRDCETCILEELCQEDSGVIALGGGALLRPKNRDLAERNGVVLLLHASISTLTDRLAPDQQSRPLLGVSPENSLHNLLQAREEHYQSFPVRFATDQGSIEDVMNDLEVELGRFLVTGMGKSYQVQFVSGIIQKIGMNLKLHDMSGPITIVTDQNVAGYYAEELLKSVRDAGYRSSLIVIPPGENSKHMNTVQDLWNGFLKGGVDRSSTIIAFGGGVVGDLTGFAAATFHRGVNWVNIPTSLLAIVDAAIGGKTGVDLAEGKNLIGAFHPPRQVWIDIALLDTLPEREIVNGMAEVIKHGVIADPELYQMVSAGRSALDDFRSLILKKATAVKIQIIREDPYEQNIRQALNFGHTIGHGVEHASGFQISHGEAIAIGIVAETRIAEYLGLTETGLSERVIDILQKWSLPVDIPINIPKADIWDAVQNDKKRVAGKLQFALPVDIGQIKTHVEVPEKIWKAIINSKSEIL